MIAAGLERFGPFFTLELHPPGSFVEPWRPMAELVDSGAVGKRITAVAHGLAAAGPITPDAVPSAVSASVAQLGLVARLAAPAVGAAVLDLKLPRFRLSALGWQDRLGGGFPLALTSEDSGSSESWAVACILDDAVEPITTAVRDYAGVSERVLWGNVASSINSAAVLIGRSAPALADRAFTIAQELLRDTRLADETGEPGPGFRRHSCCLIYQLSGSTEAVCGDCVLGGRD
ncbi:hypothetical protein GCM10011575_17920 [Microlunatus endophyticus]|uniref:Ferric siderophore reductase C-terminal domain-containing protein n=1 Tax=Microlunatus endophyticus TaxID=1716077 RepID=A0A917S5L4_9ACTN|nr:(2Fe-2S)-binding protein [Microlunatus endophyticus]GGL59791.1 hypothetical protein GCM10011575_17920 [Microlunatus endophyticus]